MGLPVSDDPNAVADAVIHGAELGVVVAYGRLIKPHLLDQLRFVNLHFSLLPRWRGAAPVERAVLAGDSHTGVCLMELEEGLDTGGVFRREVTAIDPEEPVRVLRERLVGIGIPMLLDSLHHGLGKAEAQTGVLTYAAKVDPAEYVIDWLRPAVELARLTRLEQAWTTFRGRRLKVLHGSVVTPEAAIASGTLPAGTIEAGRVATGDGWLELVRVQPEGKGPMEAKAWANGAKPTPGERLGA